GSSPVGIAVPDKWCFGFASGVAIGVAAHETASLGFDHWAGGCSGEGSCAVRATQARTVVAVFDHTASPGSTTTSPPPPTITISPPAVTAGQYAGTTNHGNHVPFDGSAAGRTITNVSFAAADERCT